MNKIKAKFNEDQFSPWQDSFRDAFKSLDSVSRPSRYASQNKTIQQSSLNRKKRQQKSRMSRTSLNISKINLHNDAQDSLQIMENNQSKKYSGPRITFYAKMNPRINRKSQSNIDPEIVIDDHCLVRRKLTGKMVRDQSIKYLEIIDQKRENDTKYDTKNGFSIPKPMNLHKLGVVRARKQDEQTSYLRRLKMIYHTHRN